MDYLAEPVVDFLEVEIQATENDWKCAECGHGLTLHTCGLVVHGRCLLAGCGCKQAVLTESAKRKIKHGLLP